MSSRWIMVQGYEAVGQKGAKVCSRVLIHFRSSIKGVVAPQMLVCVHDPQVQWRSAVQCNHPAANSSNAGSRPSYSNMKPLRAPSFC